MASQSVPAENMGSSAAEELNVGHSDVSYVRKSITGVKKRIMKPKLRNHPGWIELQNSRECEEKVHFGH